jgi:hypothetical protein
MQQFIANYRFQRVLLEKTRRAALTNALRIWWGLTPS